MPVFDYTCRACGDTFEQLVLKNSVPACPQCKSEDLERLLSLPTVQSDGTRNMALRAAKQRDKKLGHERVQEQIRYEQNHD